MAKEIMNNINNYYDLLVYILYNFFKHHFEILISVFSILMSSELRQIFRRCSANDHLPLAMHKISSF